jgi:hypothetical protein
VAGAASAAVLLAAVLLLRGEAQPIAAKPPPGPTSTGTAPTSAPPTAVAPPTLPLRYNAHLVAWQSYQAPTAAVHVAADPEHLLSYFQNGATTPEEPSGSVTVQPRSGAKPITYRPPPGWDLFDVVIAGGAMYVGLAMPNAMSNVTGRLVRVDLASAAAAPFQIHSVRILPHLQVLGDELITTGHHMDEQQGWCVVAIHAGTGAERIVTCSSDVPPALTAADGGVLITDSVNCTIQLLRAGKDELEQFPAVPACQQMQPVGVRGWLAYVDIGASPTRPLVVSNGKLEIQLGPATVQVVSCHGWLYWVAGENDRELYGGQVRRWRPGLSDIEVVRTATAGQAFRWPSCQHGTLSVPVYSAPVEPAELTGLLVLDGP